jgi:hypothetical protein
LKGKRTMTGTIRPLSTPAPGLTEIGVL